MGIESTCLMLLTAAKNHGVDFDDVLTVGRQYFFPPPAALGRAFRALGVSEDPGGFKPEYAEPFFRLLGARKIEAIDYSDYEGAEIIHDMNRPLPPELRNRSGVVFDGGSMEHVFFAGQALKNMMELVRVGGWFIQVTPANNMMGHGFWQAGPEVAFRAFTPENGFDRPFVFLKETQFDEAWYAVKEPAKVRRRVELNNVCYTMLCTIARKVADVEIFGAPPQQSDYAAAWEASDEDRAITPPSARRRSPIHIPYRLREMIKWGAIGARSRSAFDPALYDLVPEEALLRGRLRPEAAGA